ncbi:MAG: SDR family oxidoreductase [Thermomicrobiales bacterium]|nr:SDR family oxidoreductase [Thermomicrobiales bacterium]
MNSGRLSGRVALVTGAGSGIGRAISQALARDGATVVVSDLDLDLAKQVSNILAGSFPIQLDVTSMESAKQAVSRIERELGPIDVLVNNAGVSTMAPIWDLTEKEWDFNFDVNAKGVFIVTQAVLPGMMERKRGAIVNTASMAGKKGVPLLAHYAASKWACIGFTKSCAVEVGPYGIRVNCVCPGYVATSMQERELIWEAEARGMSVENVTAEYISKTPLGRMQVPEDVARVVAYLASDDAEFLTGAAIDITGGAHLT